MPEGAGGGNPSGVELVVPASLDGVRVDKALSLLADLPRAAVADLVTSGRVRVDGKVVTTRSRPLAAGQVLAADVPATGEQAPVAADASVAFDVVHADAHVVVVDKPAGLVVHPGAGNPSGTLVNGLLARFPDLAELAASGTCPPERPGIVHRLDKGTSGLLVVARTPAAYRDLVGQLSSRTVGRHYFALVQGIVEAERGVVDAPIGRSESVATRMTVTRRGRFARTNYAVRRRIPAPASGPAAYTLLDIWLETGRTHQIRVHLAAIGHPVVGDPQYGPSGLTASGLARGRVFLHAHELAFVHPGTGLAVSYSSPLPADLAAVLDALGSTGAAGTAGSTGSVGSAG